MFSKLKQFLNGKTKNEEGIALPLVLVFLLLGSLIIVPLLSFETTGVKTGQVYEKKKGDLFAADAGIQDATWNIKYGYLDSLLVSPAYDGFDFSTTWNYSLPQQVNNRNVDVTLKNVWVPSNIAMPSSAEASAVIAAEKLLVTGSATETTGKITLTYSPGAGEDLRMMTLGVWLPRGFSYTVGSSNLEADQYASYYSVPSVQSYHGNQAILWTFTSVPFNDFPGADPLQYPVVSEITFQFTSSQPGAKPDIVAWTTTSGVADIPFSWDADTSVYQITSHAGNTTVEAYTFKEEIRHLRSALPGDYIATGNSLMLDTNFDWYGIRDQLLASSDAAVSGIPSDATVGAAYLYWSGWQNDSRIQTILSDSCSNFNNWVYGSTWSINNNTFRSHYSGGADSTRYNTLQVSRDLSTNAAGTVKVSWDQWVTALTDLFNDSGNNFNNWNNGSAWNVQSNDYFRGHYSSGDNTTRLLTLINSQNLTAYAGEVVNLSWDQWTAGTPGSADGLDFALSADGGITWSNNITAFRGNIGSSAVNFSYTIPSQYLTGTFKMQFYVVGMSDSGEYAKVENVKITPAYSALDGLDFGFSDDGGTNWSNNIQAFRGDIGNSAVNFSYVVPYQYLSNNFKIRFYIVGMSQSGEYVNQDNIKIVAMPADTSITFSIDGTQVYFDGQGQPAQGSQPLTASSAQVFAGSPSLGGFSYASYKDVTSLVRTYSAKAPDPAVNHPGNGTYTVGDVLGDTGGQISYAGWSLIIVYTSGNTTGHQLFLYDRFLYSPGNIDVDFDNDGMPGGYISGFIVPDQIPGEQDAAKLTVFVGEGDDVWTGDFVAFNAPASYQSHPEDIPDSDKLWDGTYSVVAPGSNTPSNPDNVWNGKSVGLSADGVDIDTFSIPWSSGMLQPSATSARIDLYSEIDNWNLIYIIVSFRSSVTTGNALSYLIR